MQIPAQAVLALARQIDQDHEQTLTTVYSQQKAAFTAGFIVADDDADNNPIPNNTMVRLEPPVPGQDRRTVAPVFTYKKIDYEVSSGLQAVDWTVIDDPPLNLTHTQWRAWHKGKEIRTLCSEAGLRVSPNTRELLMRQSQAASISDVLAYVFTEHNLNCPYLREVTARVWFHRLWEPASLRCLVDAPLGATEDPRSVSGEGPEVAKPDIPMTSSAPASSSSSPGATSNRSPHSSTDHLGLKVQKIDHTMDP